MTHESGDDIAGFFFPPAPFHFLPTPFRYVRILLFTRKRKPDREGTGLERLQQQGQS
jgi:hypothetical protein